MTFRVGQEVVCVDDSITTPRRSWDERSRIIPGAVYEVREVGVTLRGLAGIRLVGRSLGRKTPVDRFYRSSRFRPVIYDTTRAVEALKASLPQLKTMKVEA